MEQKSFINSETMKPSIASSKKLSFARINIMLVLGAIATVSIVIPVGVALVSHK